MTAATVFETDHVIVTADLRPTETVVVGLSNFLGDRYTPFGDGLVQVLGHSGVFVTSKRKDWWQTPHRAAFCAAVARAVAPYNQRIAYGASMGGYGALTLAAEMGCNRALAISPQCVLSDPDHPLDPIWAAEIAQRPVLRDDVAADLGRIVPEVLYDPVEPIDRLQIAYLAARRPIIAAPFPFATHKLLQTFKECGIASSATGRLLKRFNRTRIVRKEFRKARRGSARYLAAAAAWCQENGHDGLVELYARRFQAAVKLPADNARARFLAEVNERRRVWGASARALVGAEP